MSVAVVRVKNADVKPHSPTESSLKNQFSLIQRYEFSKPIALCKHTQRFKSSGPMINTLGSGEISPF